MLVFSSSYIVRNYLGEIPSMLTMDLWSEESRWLRPFITRTATRYQVLENTDKKSIQSAPRLQLHEKQQAFGDAWYSIVSDWFFFARNLLEVDSRVCGNTIDFVGVL